MRCPVCKGELIVKGKARLQSLDEHVSNPNGVPTLKDKYCCSNSECKTHEFGIVWNEYGEMYSSEYTNEIVYIDGNCAPFGSFQRKINVEIYKDDENLHFRFGKYHLELDWKYKANEDGKILSKTPSFKLWIDGTMYISGIRMFFFLLRQHYAHKKFRVGEDYEKDFEYPTYFHEKKDWWRWFAPFVLRIIDWNGYQKSKMK